MVYRILVVEDDPTIAALVCENLARWGFQAQAARDFGDVLGEFQSFQPHLTLMDVSLPFFNGFYWCGEIRKLSKSPILFLSSRAESMDVVMAVNMGGDDYVTKPFSMEVLIAKINALLRRAYDYAEGQGEWTAGGATLRASDATLVSGGARVECTRNETKILATLIERKGKIVSRDELMNRLWDSDSFIDDNTLTVNINRLRKKLADVGLNDFIVTKKGLGYMVRDD